MPKPTPEKATAAPETRPSPRAFTVRDIRAIEHGAGVVELVEVTYRGVPSSVRTLYKGAREVVMQDARLYEENKLGPDRLGDTGLVPKWNGNLGYPERE
jgi:hypothetical protein